MPPRYASSRHIPWILTEWIRYNAKPRSKNGKTQQSIDKMMDKVLDSVDTIVKKIEEYDNRNTGNHWYYSSRLAYFDKTNMVFRLFYKYRNTFSEHKRVYMDGKKFLFATPKDGKWVTNGSFTSAQFGYRIINMEDVYSLPHCAYLCKFEVNTVHKVVSIMRNAEIEQLHNMGFTNLARKMVRNDSITTGIKEYIGEPDKKKKNVCQRYHLTRAQLDYLNSINEGYYSYDSSRLTKIKEILGTNDLSHIDIENFKKYHKITKNTWHLRIFDGMTPEDRKKLFIRIANMSTKNENAMQIFYDTYNMATNHNIDIMNIRTYDELIRAHNAAMEMRRIEQEERQRLYAMKMEERNKELEKKMEKLDKERKKLNYEEDEFIIRIPEKLSEIVAEGNALRHCVGGYTERHAMGNTTILFLRRKSEADKPFYTIEVNKGNVVQIHGFGNRWLGCNPEAIPTVARWLKKNKIHCDDRILRSKATGYCGNNDLVPMPAI